MNAQRPAFLQENACFAAVRVQHPFRLDEPMHPVQIAGFRKMSAAQKFAQVEAMYRTGVSMKVSQLRKKHPEWDEAQLEIEARRAVMYGPD